MQPLPNVFVFSTQCGGGVCNTKNEFEVLPARGTLYSMDSENALTLAHGHMLIIAGQIDVNLTAGKLKLKITPGSSIVAEVDADGATRLYSLSAYEKGHTAVVTAQPELGLKEDLSLPPGQELIIASTSLNSDELIAADGLAIGPVDGSLKLVEQTSGRMHLVNYSLDAMQETEFLLGCKRVSIPPTERLAQLRTTLGTSEEHKHNHNLPVSSVESQRQSSVAGQIIIEDDLIAVPEARALYNVNDDGNINLLKGSMVIRSKKQTVVNAGDEQVVVSKGAVALIRTGNGMTKVTNLSDLHANSVRVIANNKSIDVLPAREIILSRTAPALGTIFDVHQVGHHSIISQPISGGSWITTAQVSLVDELAYQPLLVSIRNQDQYKLANKQMVDQIVKTAAIFQTLHGHETYVRGEIEDETTAYAMIADKGCSSCRRH